VYQVDLADHPYSVQLVAVKFAAADDTDVQFNSYGLPDSGGTLVIESGDQRRTLVLDPNSGKVEIR
jgi:hypothetical protein